MSSPLSRLGRSRSQPTLTAIFSPRKPNAGNHAKVRFGSHLTRSPGRREWPLLEVVHSCGVPPIISVE